VLPTLDLREEPGALAAHAGICAGGEEQSVRKWPKCDLRKRGSPAAQRRQSHGWSTISSLTSLGPVLAGKERGGKLCRVASPPLPHDRLIFLLVGVRLDYFAI
jgi:hypothetical protein